LNKKNQKKLFFQRYINHTFRDIMRVYGISVSCGGVFYLDGFCRRLTREIEWQEKAEIRQTGTNTRKKLF
jgi:hypothetical protein